MDVEKDNSVAASVGVSDKSGTQSPVPEQKSPFAGMDLNKPIREISKIRWALTCIGLYLGGFLFGLDTTITATVQGPIYERFQDIENLPWVGIAFPMGSVALLLYVGQQFGTYELKTLTIAFTILFEIGSMICGAAPNMDALIIGRVIAGIGGAGMFISVLNYISIFVNMKQQPIYNAGCGLAWGVGAILGPVIGGSFADSSATWRWAFYINGPLAAAVSPLYIFAFPMYQPQPDKTLVTKLKETDWIGVLLNAATFVLFMVVLTFAGSTWAWDSAQVIAIFVVFGVVLVLYGIQQVYCIGTTPERRVFPVQFVKRRTMLLLFIGTGACTAACGMVIYYVPIFFQFTKGDGALKAAVRLLPYVAPYVFSVMLAGGLSAGLGMYTPFYVIGGVFTLAGAAAMFTIDSSTAAGNIYGYEVLLAIGTGLTFQTAYAVAVVKSRTPMEIPQAIGFINVAQVGCITIGLTLAGVIFQNVGFQKLSQELAEFNFSEAEIRSALAGFASNIFREHPEAAQRAINAIVDTIALEYALGITSGCVLIVVGCLMKWEKLQLDPSKL